MRDVQRALKRKCFNSIKGTIKTKILNFNFSHKEKFQFHKRYD